MSAPYLVTTVRSSSSGLVGRSLGLYNVYLGGSFEGTRLARLYRGDVRAENLATLLGSVIDQFRADRREGEAFGDWSNRVLLPV